MEHNVQSHSEHLSPVLLYRDDIERIIELLSEISPRIELSNHDHKFNDVKEWAEVKKAYHTDIQMGARGPYISLDMNERSVFLYIAEDTAQSRGVFEKIKRLLADRKPPGHRLLNPWMPAIAFSVCLWALLFLASSITRWAILGAISTLLVGAIGWWVLAWRFRFKKYSVIIPKYRIEAPNFWNRNSDKIVVAIIAAVLGSLLTLLINSLG
jgi:hypothetical protein